MKMDKFVVEDQTQIYNNLNNTITCRICLEKNQNQLNNKMSNIFEGSTPLCSMIMSCASVQIYQDDGLPNAICQKCLTKLNIAWQFKVQCEMSDSRLRQYYIHTSTIKLDESNNFHHDIQTQKTDIPENDIENVEKTQDDEEPQKNIIEEDMNFKSNKLKNGSKSTKEPKIHQCDTCGKIFNRREYLTQHIRIHTGEKPYCCHICEKRFVNSGHLTTHMRTHTGEKPHACTMCPKAFSTRQELNKHTMVHQGIRPFVCATCGKCFGSSSNLYSHLRHHTGEKNFTCEHCGKAFYTKQELKQHLVVHTGEKAFQCEYCNKKFSQIAHLRRHLKLHL